MRTITITAYKRPLYLKEMLKSLLPQIKGSDFKVYFAVEPGNQEVLDICQNFNYENKIVIANPVKLGVRENPFQILKKVFNDGSDFNIYLEDDIVLSPDAIKAGEAYFDKQDKSKVFCFCLYHHESFKLNVKLPNNEIWLHDHFAPLGWCCTKEQWTNYFEPFWHTHANGWDWSIVENAKERNLKIYVCALSRSHHIGRFGGTHYSHKHHDHLYIKNPYNKDAVIAEFIFKD